MIQGMDSSAAQPMELSDKKLSDKCSGLIYQSNRVREAGGQVKAAWDRLSQAGAQSAEEE